MTIEITHALSVEIAASFGCRIQRTRSQEHREKIERSAEEFVRSLPHGWQDNIRELVRKSVSIWTPSHTLPLGASGSPGDASGSLTASGDYITAPATNLAHL